MNVLKLLLLLFMGSMGFTSKASFKPENTVIAFDFNKVLANYNKSPLSIAAQISRGILKSRGLIFYHAYKYGQEVKATYPQYKVKEEFFEFIFDKYPELRAIYEQLYLDGAADQIVNQSVIDIVIKLKTAGYTPTIFSNMGRKIYDNMKIANPEIAQALSHFDALELVACKDDQYICKPQKDFYIKYIELARAIKPDLQNIVFVDDRQENLDGFAAVCADQNINFYGYHFKGENATAQGLHDFLISIDLQF